MQSIVLIPAPVLQTPAKPVVAFDKKLAKLIASMKETLRKTRNPRGVGLAAPQIGVPYRIFVTRPSPKAEIRVFINPEIKSASAMPNRTETAENRSLEGCLSIPGVWGQVGRSPDITLSWQDESGTQHEEPFSGFFATIIQHETDHLNGVLFTQRVVEQKQKLYQSSRDDEGKEVLEELKLPV